jgi:hypothetical protein
MEEYESCKSNMKKKTKYITEFFKSNKPIAKSKKMGVDMHWRGNGHRAESPEYYWDQIKLPTRVTMVGSGSYLTDVPGQSSPLLAQRPNHADSVGPTEN